MEPKVFLTIPTRHLDESIAFYRDVLQFRLKERLNRPNGIVLVFLTHADGFTVEFVAGPNTPAGEVGPGAPLLTFMIQDFSDITARLLAAGMPVPAAMALPNGISMLRIKDPNGVMVSFVAGKL